MADEVTGSKGPVPNIDALDTKLLFIGSGLILLVSILLISSLVTRWLEYDGAIRVTLKQSFLDHAAVLSYAQSLDATIMKTTSLMLSFLVVFVGAAYVLRSGTVGFKLILQGQSGTSTLETASPGLVMITLGLAVAVATLAIQTKADYKSPTYQLTTSPPGTQQKAPNEQRSGGTSSDQSDSGGIPIKKGLKTEPLENRR